MSWRECKSLSKLLQQVNALWPNRSKASDGTIGDTAHQQRKSDHDPNAAGVVCAVDITNDPQNGIASRKLAERLVASRDKRIAYIISDGQICSSTLAPWAWRTYHGTNGHFHHVHISVKQVPGLYDDETPWNLEAGTVFEAPVKAPLPTLDRLLKRGVSGGDVIVLQNALGIKPRGTFDAQTEVVVKQFQTQHNLTPDGKVGPLTWKALGGE